MTDSDKQALLDGTATIQTEIVVHNENLLNIDSYTTTTTNGSFTILDDGFIQFINNTGNAFIVDFDTINVTGNTVYTLTTEVQSNGDNKRTYIFEQYDNNNNKLKTNYFRTNLTITTENTTSYLKIRLTTDNTNTQDNFIISIRLEEGTPISLTETNSVIDWNHEDFRQVKEEGWIGQFVARQVTGNLHNLDDDFKITDKELELKLGVRTNDNTNWYSLGNFLVTKVTDDEVNDKTSFEALDYTKKFNKAYEDTIEYPCTALQLAQNVCAQCGVALGSSSFKNDDYVIEGNAFTNNESCRDVMKAIGKLAFSWVRVDWDNKVYIDFNPLPFKNQFDKDNANILTSYISYSGVLTSSDGVDKTIYIPCKPNTTYTISKMLQQPTSTNRFRLGTSSEIPTNGITMNDLINKPGGTTDTFQTITTGDNANYLCVFIYTSSGATTTLDEMLDSLQIYEQPSQYNTFGNNKYYNLKTQKEVFGPVDKVVIGYSAIEGERTYIGSEDGTCVINIFDNPLVFNQEQRASIIESARDLLGFTYTPLNTLTVGHPWLKGNEIVRVSDMESVSHDTIPFDRTIQYFGHIKTLIDSTIETKTNDNLAYKPEMVKNYERSEISNDQINKQISIIINEQTNTSNRLNSTISTLDGTIQRVSATETSITDIVTTTQSSIGKNSLYLEDAMEGNVLSYSIDGASEQDTYSGKNLCGIPDQTFTHNGVTVTIQDGEITLNGTATASGTKNLTPIKTTTLQAQQYTLSKNYISGSMQNDTGQSNFNVRNSSSGSFIFSVTLQESKKSYTFSSETSIIFGIYVYSGVVYNNYKFKPQLELGSTATDWEKYVGGTESPNPDYPQEIKSIPSIENIFDIDSVTSVTNGSLEDGLITSNTTGQSNNYNVAPVFSTHTFIAGKTYYLSADIRIKSGVGILNKINDYVADWISVTKPTLTTEFQRYVYKKTFTSNTNYYRLLFQFGNVNSSVFEIKNIMIEESQTPHEYVPYGYYTRVKVTGKNLINTSTAQKGYYYNVNAISTSNNWCIQQVPVKPNTTYYLSGNNQDNTTAQIWLIDKNKNRLSTVGNYKNTHEITTTSTTAYIGISIADYDGTADMDNIMLEQGSTATPYEQYKENVVLIDMSKEDLFTEYEDGYINSSTGEDEAGVGTHRSLYIPVKPNTTYTPSFNVNRVVEYTQDKQFVKNTFNVSNAIKLSATTYYVRLAFGNTVTTNTLDNVTFFESNNATPYYELCKTGDNKDRLVIDSTGNCVINKKIGKVVLNGSEPVYKGGTTLNQYFNAAVLTNYIKPVNNDQNVLHFSSHFINKSPNQLSGGSVIGSAIRRDNAIGFAFGLDSEINTVALCKTWLSNNEPEFYYQMETPETITLPNTKIPLFEGINHITLIDDLETDTSVVYYRKTPLSGTYATLTQLNDVSTEKTQEIQTVRQEVLTEITNESLRIDVVRQEIDETGVPILNTGTGYTFDLDGLKMEKTDQDVKSQLDNDGLSVKYKNEDVLTARSNGVNAVNMTVNKFYIQKPIRMEKTKSISDSTQTGLGFFYIGE